MNRIAGRVLVLGSDTRSFLSVVRSLGQAGLAVHVAWCPEDSAALASRYVNTLHRLPPYCIDRLCDLLRKIPFDLVIPCDDFAIVPLQAHRKGLPPDTRVFLLSDEAFAVCSDKAKTYELAERLGIPRARQRAVASIEELDAAAAQFGWPLVLKPASSVSLAEPGVRRAVRKAWKLEEARAIARLPLLVQEHFIGVGLGVEVLCREGEVLAAFQHQRVHEPLDGGGSSYRKSMALSPDLLDAACKLMAAIRYTGVGMVEFRVNPATGAWILIEINGRFWGSLPLSIAAGVDFPRYLYDMLVHGRGDFPRTYRVGVYARNWLLDLRWLARNFLTGCRDPKWMGQLTCQVLRELRNLPREHSDTFTIDDPRPACREVRRILQRAARPATGWLQRGRLQRKAVAAAKNARRVLFVCKGNICRSPFAAEYLRKLAPAGIEIESAGCLPMRGRPSPSEAVEAALEFGVDLQGHRSHILTECAVGLADAIFIFEHDQEESLRSRFPGATGKIFYVSALAGRMSGIRDPWSAGQAVFCDVYREIAGAISSGWDTGVTVPTKAKRLHPSFPLHLSGGKACKDSQLSH